MKKIIAFVCLGALLLLAGLAAACKSSDTATKNRVSALETQVSQGTTASQNVAMAAALQALAAPKIHEFATAVDAGTLTAGESDSIQLALGAISAVQWPADLQSQAQDLEAKLRALLTALATDDIKQIKAPADAAHELNDSFPGAVNAELARKLSLPTPIGGGGETPSRTGTPAGTPTP